MNQVTVRCAWCQTFLRVSPATAEAARDGMESHGICRPCSTRQLAQMGISLERDQDGVARPRYLEPKTRREAA